MSCFSILLSCLISMTFDTKLGIKHRGSFTLDYSDSKILSYFWNHQQKNQQNKTWESTLKKQSPDGAAVLPQSKSAYQSFWIRVPQSAFFVMNLGAKILPPSTTSISAIFCCCDTDSLLVYFEWYCILSEFSRH